jgi:F-type H+-transporting ATPase subunit a
MVALLGFVFEPPTTKEFVWPCIWGKGDFCFNFIMLLALIAFLATILFFVLGLRKPKVVPGKFQLIVESGVEFVRVQIMQQMIGPEGEPFLPFLATLFFFIFFGNIIEVIPLISFPLNSRLAFPLVMALTSWVLYNAVGIKRHGFLGYLKTVLFPPGAPVLAYVLLTPIEFISVIVIRPITLSVRLFANMVAGHLLLTVFFLGSLALLTGFPYVVGLASGVVAVVLVGFEIFVSALQAFIFTVLTASYIGGAMATEH